MMRVWYRCVFICMYILYLGISTSYGLIWHGLISFPQGQLAKCIAAQRRLLDARQVEELVSTESEG